MNIKYMFTLTEDCCFFKSCCFFTLGSLENFRISSGPMVWINITCTLVFPGFEDSVPQSCSSRVHSDAINSHDSSIVKSYKISNHSYCYPLSISPRLCRSQCLQNKAIQDPKAKGQPVACPAELCPFLNGVAGHAVLQTKEKHLSHVTNINNSLHRRQGP